MYTYTFRRCITINIYTQVCGIIIPVIILMMIILNKRRLFLRTEIYFLAILISALLVNVTDIVSQYILLHHDDFSVEIQRTSSKIYALMVTVVVTATMGYINADIFYDKKLIIILGGLRIVDTKSCHPLTFRYKNRFLNISLKRFLPLHHKRTQEQKKH